VDSLGEPIEGLTDEELAAFERGRALFEKRFKPSEGLGPLYNATSCLSCHSSPAPGGSSELYRNFYIAVYGTGPSSILPGLPGTPSPVVPAFGSGNGALDPFTLEGGRIVIPETIIGFPVSSAQRNSIPIFGVGLFEFVDNNTIIGNSDPEDLDGDGISGRFNRDGAGLGRFGVKAQSNNIELFTRAPLMNQMGVTSDPFLGIAGTVSLGHSAITQASSNPNARTVDNDGVPDPEISHDDLGDLIAFTRFLAPPQPREFNAAAVAGEQLFEQVGCTSCHMPELPSTRGPVRAYTDLLIHDMGTELADNMSFGIPQFSSLDPNHTGSEFRTQPLWGVSRFPPYLHDGRAPTLLEAIELHGGEAEKSRDEFRALLPDERDAIISFLEHL
jgi:CxxC motif-containing protein (DUF1111 family)